MILPPWSHTADFLLVHALVLDRYFVAMHVDIYLDFATWSCMEVYEEKLGEDRCRLEEGNGCIAFVLGEICNGLTARRKKIGVQLESQLRMRVDLGVGLKDNES